MHITQITLKHYRNYDLCHIDLSKRLNLIIGDNGQGKTNLLESLYIGGFGKSFRTSKDVEWLKFGEPVAFVKIGFEKMGQPGLIEIKLLRNRKKEIKLNGVHLSKMSELIGHLNLVLFSPEDLRLVKDSPSERRKFIDRELSHISPAYCHKLLQYNRVLDQRNSSLKQMQMKRQMDAALLDIWDEQLADLGSHLIIKREQFIKDLAQMSQRIHGEITSGKENLIVTYICSLNTKSMSNYDTIKSDFVALLIQNRQKDMERGYTSVGPHRDDLGLFIDTLDLKAYGSQGQQRTAALALKLSEIEIIYETLGEYPVLLLDDVMSELDSHRQNFLIKTFEKVQTIVTTTEVGQIYQDHLNDGKLFRIEGGRVL